ncbi:MAG: hypothetical protein R3B70_43245 [Polyangiaceae bacterium]
MSLRGALSLGLASGAGLGLADALLTSLPPPNSGSPRKASSFTTPLASPSTPYGAPPPPQALHRRRKEIRTARNFLDNLATLGAVIALPVLLHGTFDTALRRGSPSSPPCSPSRASSPSLPPSPANSPSPYSWGATPRLPPPPQRLTPP